MSSQPFTCLFPGQGSQSIGMLTELAEQYPIVRAVFDQGSTILGDDLWQLTQHGPEERLNQTQYTQPIMLIVGVAIYRLWIEQGGRAPKLMAGHSLGEYTALVCAGVIEFADAVRLVAKRAELMQQAVPLGEGAMAAIIGLDSAEIETLCAAVAQEQVVAPANFNSLQQTVIAGHTAAVERTIQLALEKGAKIAKKIPVSVPAHCMLLVDAAQRFAEHLESVPFNSGTVPVVNNVDVAVYTHPDDVRDALMRQLYKPVRWVETIQRMVAEHCLQAVEMGPGKVLAGLNRRIVAEYVTYPVNNPSGLQRALTELA